MANAPKPGSLSKETAAPPAGSTSLRITLCGTTLELNMALPIKERFAVRAATGLPLKEFWGGEEKVDTDSFKILWWLARRANDEPRLPLSVVEDEWPEHLTEDDLVIEEITDDPDEDTDDPESSGPA